MSQPKGNKQPPSGGKNARVHFPLDNEEMDVTVDESSNSINDQQGLEIRQPRRGFRQIIRRIRLATHMRPKKSSIEANAESLSDVFTLNEVKKYIQRDPFGKSGSMANSYQRQISGASSRTQLATDPTISSARNYIVSSGEIKFWKAFGFDQDAHPFVKITHDINVEDIAHIMHKLWRMQPPRIVALIISNVDTLKEWTNTRQIINFQKGLIKAANTTNMWIFTNGANIGASKIIGDAVNQETKERQSFHCHPSHTRFYSETLSSAQSLSMSSLVKAPQLNFIGIIREDMIKNADQLGSDPKENPLQDSLKVNIENQGNCPEEGKYELDPDHSHFIVVRDSTVNKTGINLFLVRLMQFLSTVGGSEFIKSNIESDLSTKVKDVPDLCSLTNMEIPVVTIVIQGGYDCARLVVDCLKRQFPVVILRGSGGLADLLSFAYTELEQRSRQTGPWGTWDAEYVENFLKPEIVTKIATYFPKLRENVIARNLLRDRVLECIRLAKQNSLSFITVLNMHNCAECKLENLSVYLLRALFKSKPRSSNRGVDYNKTTSNMAEASTVSDDKILKELYLCLDWNCPDVARSEVLIRDPSYVSRLQKDLFQSALLRPYREEFVDLFLAHGFRLHKFVTPTRLRRLYKQSYKEDFFLSVCWEGVLGHSLLRKPSKHFIDTDLNWLIQTCTGFANFISSDHLYYNVMGMYVRNALSAERQALTILTLWACLSNRQKLARTLWKHSDQPIHLALVVSMVFYRLSKYVGDTNLKTELKEQSRLFAEMATGVLEDCYTDATCRAFDVLSEESPDWNYKTAVDIASNAKTKIFLAHPCCQKWLTNTFHGDIRIRELSWGIFTVPACVKITLCAFLVLPMYVWVRFKPKVLKVEVEKPEDIEEDEKDGDGGGGMDEIGISSNQNHSENVLGGDHLNLIANPSAKKKFTEPPIKAADYATLFRDREVLIRQQPPLWQMIKMMWTAPITKFHTFHIFYIIYLLVFSYAVLYPSCGNQTLDFVICGWTSLILVEYVRRTWILYRNYTSVPMLVKCLELLLIFLFVIVYTTHTAGLGLGWLSLTPYGRKVTLCTALVYFYYRYIFIYLPISSTLGPLLYRLRLMVTVDFLNFMQMGLVIIISGGIVMQALLYPDLDITWHVIKTAFDRAWFSLFITPTGDLTADAQCSKSYKADPPPGVCYAGLYNHTASPTPCPHEGAAPYIFAIEYFVLLKLILLTLLYALFSARASKIQAETDAIWKYQRYNLVIDFANRLPLPSPLSIFCFAYYILKWFFGFISCYYCFKFIRRIKSGAQVDGGVFDDDSRYQMRLSEEDYNFWRHLARQYAARQDKIAEEKDITKKQWDGIQAMAEEIEYEKKLMKKMHGKMSELERMMNLSHVYLENIKHISSLKFGNSEFEGGLSKHSTSLHILSRQSPYPGTRVQRIPVPDKYVPWEVMWVDYDPVAYTKQKCDFSTSLQSHVDEDILLLQELNIEELTSKLPVFKWNTSSMNPAGITIDRSSWILNEDGTNMIYVLDRALPRNPFGRTGLKGRGSLPRWGPNHYVVLIITRWRSTKIISGGKVFEFVVEKNLPRWNQISLPVRFVPDENLFTGIQKLFKLSSNQPWNTSEDMVQFFESCVISSSSDVIPEDSQGIRSEIYPASYMDDPHNTDMSWKEIVLYHIHFNLPDNLNEKMTQSLNWRVITEDLFLKLPSGQSTLLQNIINKLQATIL